ncbi:MAG: hypothetical protein LBO71_03325 [Prevotellaceae bacterium]|jgi:hypothetical protein|nr:hypothetical protein [Prevotellaceae bacterium]
MSKAKHAGKQQAAKVSKLRSPQEEAGLPERLEKNISKRKRLYMLLCLLTALIFSLLLFDVNVSEGTDDSTYIEAGYRYATDFFSFHYTFSAPLYCMFLALPIAIFGVNLVILKLFSVLFFVLGIYFLYVALKGRIPYITLFPALLLTALNSLYLYHASQTFTEAFVLPLSGLFLLALFKLDDATQSGVELKKSWKNFLLLGFMTFIFYLSRNVAAIAIAVVFAYFMLYKKYLTAVYSACSFALFWGLYQKVMVPAFWGHLNIKGGLSGQAGAIFLKNVYNPGEGKEDFWGMASRFFENAKTYSSQFFELIGVKSETSPHSYLFFILMLALVGVSLGYAIAKKQKYIVALILYVAAFLSVTFISLDVMWKQGRLVMVYIPMLVAIASYGIIMLLKAKFPKPLGWLYPAAIIFLVLVNLNHATDNVREHLPKLRKNIAGNKYYGFTPDWVNYFRMSEWAAKNLDKDKAVTCRKASMSFVYTGRSFSGISSVPTLLADSALALSSYKQRFLGMKYGDVPMNIIGALHPYLVAIAVGDNTSYYYTYDLPEPLYAEVEHADIPIYTSPEELMAVIKKCRTSYAVFPDSLLEALKSRNVGYIIDASLRTNPAQKTGSTISTITRYMSFIQQKYPDAFRQIHQIGADDNEPAMIYEISY